MQPISYHRGKQVDIFGPIDALLREKNKLIKMQLAICEMPLEEAYSLQWVLELAKLIISDDFLKV